MYTATAGLMFDTPEDAARAADLLNSLFEQAQARQRFDETDNDPRDEMLAVPPRTAHLVGVI